MPAFTEFFGGNTGDAPGGLPGSRVGIAETFPRILCGGENVAWTTANWNAVAIYLPSGLKVSGITMFSGAALAAGTHQWFGIWDKNLALWGGSADDTSTAWGANSAKRLALTTPKTTAYNGLYYVGGCITAGTVPGLIGTGQFGGTSANGLITRGLTPALRVLDSTTADTALAPTLTQAAAATATTSQFYAVLD